ncbi:MAG: hypothetical protein ABIP57_21450 [Jatrophihabitantaceae bacterium]
MIILLADCPAAEVKSPARGLHAYPARQGTAQLVVASEPSGDQQVEQLLATQGRTETVA